MRAAQFDTLKFFAAKGDKGALISDVAKKFVLKTSSARSRVLRCHAQGWLGEKAERGPTGPMRRFFLTADGTQELKSAMKR